MFRYHPTFKFIQMHKNLTDAIEEGSELYRLKTEDGVEIRRLYIKLLNPAVGCEEVKFLLSIYGSIEEITIFGRNVKSGWKMRNRGFVTFDKSFGASCALINRKNFSELFELNPADTWNQPDYLKLKSTESRFWDFSSDCGSLEVLNDDCLLHVMSFLDPLEVFHLEKVCGKFAELSKFYFKRVRILNFDEIKRKKKLTLHEARMIFEAVGPNIVRVSINSEKFHSKRILNFIPKYLQNLKHLHLTGFKLDLASFWDQMSSTLKNLETLDLSDNSQINEDFLKCFTKFQPKLKFLSVSNCSINGKFLKNVPQIENLDISGCRFIRGQKLIAFAEGNLNLKSLNISKCPNISGREVNDLLKKIPHCRSLYLNNYYVDDETSRFVIPSINPLVNLKELTITNINFPPCDQLLRTINLDNSIEVLNVSYGNLTLTSVYAISTMKNLKKLIMNFKNSVPEDLVDYLMELNELEEIHMSCCSYISPANVLRLFQLPRLKFLDISRCYGFSNEFIIEAAERLKERQVNMKFLIHVGQTEIDKQIFTQKEMVGAHDFLQLKWEATKDLEYEPDYDIDEGVNRDENTSNPQEFFTVDDIINILSNIDECDPNLVEKIKKNL